jgi:galactose mutarotase-like enzyme
MPFSIGNHVTFKAPLLDVGDAADLQFRNDLPDHLIRANDRTFAGEVVPSPYRGQHALYALPKRRAVGLGGTKGVSELTVIDPSGLTLGLRHWADAEPEPPAIRFNLWADAEEGFFSPEPWLGTQNALNSGAGLVRLEPGADWHWTIEIIPGWTTGSAPTQPEKSP